MTTSVARADSNWTQDQIKLIKDTVAKGATDDEFTLFLYTATKYNLDPLIKQIWCVKYGNSPAAIFTGRDGFLAKAHESGQFNGLKTIPEFDVEGVVISATCSVYRKDMDHPIEVTAYLKEYTSGKANWLKMPTTMICKVAESQALRKAFNISGIYSEDEKFALEEGSKSAEKDKVDLDKKQSTELLTKTKAVIDEYKDAKDLQANYKRHVKEQAEAGMHQKDIDLLKKHINAKNVTLKKGGQKKQVKMP